MIRFSNLLPNLLVWPRGGGAPRRIQHAALPFVEMDAGVLVCLITSRDSGRWVVPKGWPKPDMAPHELAALEAYEEAGLRGTISQTALGSFDYVKRLHMFASVRCMVDLYPMRVSEQLLDWPERRMRRLAWMPPASAAGLVEEPSLSALIATFHPARV